jgi:hypothetical protein
MSSEVLCLDISTKQTGWAVGTAGQAPRLTGVIHYPDNISEARRFAHLSDSITAVAKVNGCGFVIFSEFYHTPNPEAARANLGLRGAMMADFSRLGIEPLPIAEITARKAAGVDVGMKLWPEEEDAQKKVKKKKRDMKFRVAFALKQLGLSYATDDEADAAILLLGALAVVEIGEKKAVDLDHPF